MSVENKAIGRKSRCVVAGCNPDPSANLARVPKDLAVRTLWLRILKREDLLTYNRTLCVCFTHFKREMFGPTGRVLTRTAIPYLEETSPECDPKEKQSPTKSQTFNGFQETKFFTNASIQTEKYLMNAVDYEIPLREDISKLKEQIKTATAVNEWLRNESTSMRTFLKQADAYLSYKVFDMVKAELRAKKLINQNEMKQDKGPMSNINIFRRKTNHIHKKDKIPRNKQTLAAKRKTGSNEQMKNTDKD